MKTINQKHKILSEVHVNPVSGLVYNILCVSVFTLTTVGVGIPSRSHISFLIGRIFSIGSSLEQKLDEVYT